MSGEIEMQANIAVANNFKPNKLVSIQEHNLITECDNHIDCTAIKKNYFNGDGIKLKRYANNILTIGNDNHLVTLRCDSNLDASDVRIVMNRLNVQLYGSITKYLINNNSIDEEIRLANKFLAMIGHKIDGIEQYARSTVLKSELSNKLNRFVVRNKIVFAADDDFSDFRHEELVAIQKRLIFVLTPIEESQLKKSIDRLYIVMPKSKVDELEKNIRLQCYCSQLKGKPVLFLLASLQKLLLEKTFFPALADIEALLKISPIENLYKLFNKIGGLLEAKKPIGKQKVRVI